MSDLNYLNCGRGSGNGSQEIKRDSSSFREILLINKNYSVHRYIFYQPFSLSPPSSIACVFLKKYSQ